MEQQTFLRASMLEQHSREIEQNLEMIEAQILELKHLLDSIAQIESSKENSLYSSLGKGIYLKTKLEDKNLLVQVGAGVALKKTPEQTSQLIKEQLKKFQEAKSYLLSQREALHSELSSIIELIEKNNSSSKNI